MRSPWSMALAVSKFSPPSENALSVTLRIPMTSVRSDGKSANVLRVAFRTTDSGPVFGPVPGTAPIDMGILPSEFQTPSLVYPGVHDEAHGLISSRRFAKLATNR